MAFWFNMSLLQNEPLAKLRARCKARMLIFDFLFGSPKQLIGKKDDNTNHQVKGYQKKYKGPMMHASGFSTQKYHPKIANRQRANH